MMKEILINSLSELPNVAEQVLSEIENKKILAFYGEMGVGKTTLIKAMCEVMGVNEVVSSPTFSLVNEYHAENGEIINHFDFYRINKMEEVYDFGYEEYFYSGNYCFIEWPEKIEPLLPDDTLSVNITEQSNGKRIVCIG